MYPDLDSRPRIPEETTDLLGLNEIAKPVSLDTMVKTLGLDTPENPWLKKELPTEWSADDFEKSGDLMKASGARRRASIKDFVLSSLALGKTIPELIAHAEKHDRFIAREIEMVAAEIAA